MSRNVETRPALSKRGRPGQEPPVEPPARLDKQSTVDIFIFDINAVSSGPARRGIRVKIFRSILGVFIGYAVFAVSAVVLFHATGRDPHTQQDTTFTAIAIVYGMAFAAVGGLLSALIAGRRPVVHAALVAAVLALGAMASLLSRPGAGAIWSQLAAIVLMRPRARRRRGRELCCARKIDAAFSSDQIDGSSRVAAQGDQEDAIAPRRTACARHFFAPEATSWNCRRPRCSP